MTSVTIDIPDGFVVVIAKAAECHPDRPVNGRGLCNSCYTIAHRTGTLHRHRRVRPTRTTEEFAEEYALLRSDGLGRKRIAERLGVTRAAVDKAYIAAVRRGLLTPDRRPA